MMTKLKKRKTIIVITLSLLIAVSVALSWSWNRALVTEAEVIELKKGSALVSLAHSLERKGIIRSAKVFALLGYVRGDSRNLHAGEYRIEPGDSARDLLNKMVAGKVIQYSLTLVDGWNFRQFRDLLSRQEKLELRFKDKTDAEIMEALGHPGMHPEGRFFPDTYHYASGSTDLEIYRKSFRAMQNYLAKAWEQRAPDLPVKTPEEALTLASIVEKETGQAQERPLIAGVFSNRLKKGMRLQTDPTVIYGIGEKFDGNLRKRDLLQDTPYNSYTRRGLPPTPIAMPGALAIEAALHPADTEALYFVSRGDGSHVFSTNLKDHNQAVRKYQLGGR